MHKLPTAPFQAQWPRCPKSNPNIPPWVAWIACHIQWYCGCHGCSLANEQWVHNNYQPNKPSTRSQELELSKPFQPPSDEPNKRLGLVKSFAAACLPPLFAYFIDHNVYNNDNYAAMRAILPHDLYKPPWFGNPHGSSGHHSLPQMSIGSPPCPQLIPTLGSGLPAQQPWLVEDMTNGDPTRLTLWSCEWISNFQDFQCLE